MMFIKPLGRLSARQVLNRERAQFVLAIAAGPAVAPGAPRDRFVMPIGGRVRASPRSFAAQCPRRAVVADFLATHERAWSQCLADAEGD
jgi:hypothetical protein